MVSDIPLSWLLIHGTTMRFQKNKENHRVSRLTVLHATEVCDRFAMRGVMELVTQ